MNTVNHFLEVVGSSLVLLWRSFTYLPTLPRQLPRLWDHCFHIGYATLPIVLILSLFMGAILALQTGYSLKEIAGGQTLLGRIVGLAMARELGPLITGFLLAGRVGSSITAEISSMKVYHEVDALRTMQISPERILVMPRLVAVLIMMPLLAIVSIVVGWYGGMLVSEYVGFIDVDHTVYWSNLRAVTHFSDVFDGLLKAECFGVVVVLIACNQGLMTSGGPREIGRSVTRSVVYAMFMILLVDYCLTRVLL